MEKRLQALAKGGALLVGGDIENFKIRAKVDKFFE